MNFRMALSMVFISTKLVGLLYSASFMVRFEQPPIAQNPGAYAVERYDLYVRDAGYARVALGLACLLIVFIPFRRRERWAWCALSVVTIAYFLPIFVFRVLFPFPGWHIFWDWIYEQGLARDVFASLFFTGLMVLGLAISFPEFFAGQHRP